MVASALRRVATEVAPHASMILVQMITAGYIILSKVIMVEGISSSVFLFYQFIVATIFMAALSFIFERRNRPPLTKQILCWIFLMALLGVTFMQSMLAACLYYISSTIEAAVLNMIPVFTYTLSIISRQEKLGLDTWWGKGKLFGTLLSVSGALILMLWHGSVVALLSTTNTTSLGDWLLGLVMVVAGVLALSSWILLLRPMTSLYPAEFSLTAMMFFFAVLQTGVIAGIVSNKSSQWSLNWNLELLNIFFGGMLNSGLSNLFMTWCTAIKGPVFVASFPPLGLVFTTLLEMIFLRSSLHVGSVVGAIMIIVGLYIFLWSKSKEEAYQSMDEYESIQSSPVS